MKRILSLFSAVLVLAVASVSCVDEEQAIRQSASRFWQSIIDGKTDSAYRMLTKSSRFNIHKGDFEERVSFGGTTSLRNRTLHKAWAEECDFRIEELEQRGNEALVLVSFKVPDLDDMLYRLDKEAEREGIYKKYKNKSDKVDAWFEKRMTEELKAHRFSRMTLENQTWLLREEGEWKIDYDYDY